MGVLISEIMYIFGLILCLLLMGVGILVFKKAREISQWSHDIAGDWDVLGLSFLFWWYRIGGILFTIFSLVGFGLILSTLIRVYLT